MKQSPNIDFSHHKPVTLLFEEQVKTTPNHIAIICNNEKITYQALNDRVNQLAHYLETKKQETHNSPLAVIWMARGVNLLISILATLKAGYAYIPVDSNYPKKRVEYLINNSQAGLILTDLSTKVIEKSKQTIINLDIESNLITKEPKENLNRQPSPNDLAYIIYTSGSTGTPKGVMIEHKSVSNIITFFQKLLDISNKDKLLAVTSISFDISVLEMLLPICSGASLVISQHEISKSPSEIIKMLHEEHITIMQTTASGWEILLNEHTDLKHFPHLKNILCGGEPLQEKTGKKLLTLGANIFNAYGPTETCIWSTYNKLNDLTNPLVIGNPIQNTQLYILDENLLEIKAGEIGELFIGGTGLARGYLGNEELTSQCFIPNPFNKDETIYRTGDLVKLLPSGDIQFIGRKDSQVKIGGYRIELGEVESALLTHNNIRRCAVVLKEHNERKYIAAYLVFKDKNEPINLSLIRQHIASLLPNYMIPSIFIELENLPLTPNLKIDKKKLSTQPEPKIIKDSAYTPPKTKGEHELVEIFAEVLSVDAKSIGINDNIFELGMDSIAAIQTISRLKEKYFIQIPIKMFFSAQNIKNLSIIILEMLKSGKITQHIEPKRESREQYHSLTPAQQSLWFIQKLDGEVSPYNESAVLKLEGNLDKPALIKSLETIASRHEILHTTFKEINGTPKQLVNSSTVELMLNEMKLENTNEADRDKLITDLIKKPFQMENQYLYRIYLIEESPSSHILLFVFHHIIIDGWSIDILYRELSTLYKAYHTNKTNPLAKINIQPIDQASLLETNAKKDANKKQLSYWIKKLNGIQDLELSIKNHDSVHDSYEGGNIHFQLSERQTTELKNLTAKTKTTLFNVLMTSLSILLYKYSGQTDFAIGTAASTRNFKSLEKVLGFFSNTLALRNNLSGNPSFTQLLRNNAKTIFEAHANLDIPFLEVVKAIQPDRDPQKNPIFQVLLDMEPFDTFRPKITKKTTIIRPKKNTTKFDLTLLFQITKNKLSGNFEYSKKLFTNDAANRLIDHFTNILKIITTNPNAKASNIDIITRHEKQLFNRYNRNKKAYDKSTSLHQYVEKISLKTPNAIAVIAQDQRITYDELNKKANALANFLRNSSVSPGDLVGICLPRTVDLIITILAVLKTGAAFIPIDPNFPNQRIEYMLENSHTKTLVTTQAFLEKHSMDKRKIICLDSIRDELLLEMDANLNLKLDTEYLAYVIYTSGSTGNPKGVMISHKNILNVLLDIINIIQPAAFNKTLGLTTISFDIAYLEIFCPLMLGKQLVLAPECAQKDAEYILSILEKHQISLMQATPSTWKMLFNSTKKIVSKNVTALVGGELIGKNLAQRFITENLTAWAVYGPTEATIWSTIAKINEETVNIPSIGKPIANTGAYILDDDANQTPMGIIGELCLAGDGLSTGYLQNSQLTELKFIKNPLPNTPYKILYKTGDLACWHENGDLLIFGRNDNQIKLRGFRVDTDEIDYHLNLNPAVNNSCTIVIAGKFPKLVSYVQLKQTTQESNKEKVLREQLVAWRNVWENVYQSENVKVREFDTSGWISSFTNEPLTIEEMKEWINCSVSRIANLNPKKILEIGCGSGLIMRPILDKIDEYYGTDISAEIIERLKLEFSNNKKIILSSLEAHEINEDEIRSYDTVVFNSVAQYFPSLDYFSDVLNRFILNMPKTGKIYLGDLRNFDLLIEFHKYVLTANNAHSTDTLKIEHLAKQHMSNEKELCVSPGFFISLPEKYGRQMSIEIQLRRGVNQNEMVLFRYDVIIHLDQPSSNLGFHPTIDAEKENLSKIDLLDKFKTPPILIKNIANKRLQKSFGDESNRAITLIDPEELYQEADKNGLFAQIYWSSTSPFLVDAVISENKMPIHRIPRPAYGDHYSNAPLAAYEMQETKQKIRKELGKHLPEYMMPSNIIFLDKFPMTPNGKLDIKALPQTYESENLSAYLLPKTDTEKKLCKIWQKLLGLSKISKDSNFFEIGGHSLLSVQLISEINDEFSTELPVKCVFQTQTIEDLGKLIDKIKKIKKNFS